MLDRKFIVENADLVEQNCVNRGVKVDVHRFVQLERNPPTAPDRRGGSESQGQRGLEVDRQGQGPRRTQRPARNRAGSSARRRRRSRPNSMRWPSSWTRSTGRSPTSRTPTPRSASDDKSNLEVVPRQDAAAEVRFQAVGSRRIGREARPDGFRGRGQRGRAWLLLPQERGRAAGTGLAALCGRGAHGRGFHARRRRRTSRGTTSWPASASFPAGRRRRSTASRTPT